MSLWQRCKKGLIWSTLAVFSFHLGTQLCHTARSWYRHQYPSEVQRSFTKEFGYSLEGYDIEKTNNVVRIAAVFHKERLENHFLLDALYIRSSQYVQKPMDEQFFSVFGAGNDGYYYNDRITVQSPVWKSTVHHEIKHAKAAAIIAAHPEFAEKWGMLAKDKNGQSLYLTAWEDWCYDYKGLHSFVRKQHEKDDEQLGFVTSYARRNLDEDMAEISEEAEIREALFIPWLYTKPNPCIQAKIRLAERYQLIPRYFSEYVHVLSHQEQQQRFMETSALFLKKYPGSLYEGSLRKNRGRVLEEKAEQLQVKEYANQALIEYKLGLRAPYKDLDVYPALLEHIAACASSWKDEKTATIYRNAGTEYTKRYDNYDVLLSIDGVTDYLYAQGECLTKEATSCDVNPR